MKIPNDIQGLDNFIMKEIIHDITSGTLLTQADDQTLDLMLTHMWEILSYSSDPFACGGKLLHLWDLINIGITSDR